MTRPETDFFHRDLLAGFTGSSFALADDARSFAVRDGALTEKR
ncbi:hypothetical protein [Nocardioides humi]